MGEQFAGRTGGFSLAAGECLRITTGAALPAGADAVVMKENARIEGDTVVPAQAARAGQHVRRRAEDVAVGDTVLRAGVVLDASKLSLAWKIPALGHPDVPAYDLAAALLGRGRSARLYRRLREEKALALEISAWSWSQAGREGLFAVSAEAEPEKRDELIAAILAEIAALPSSELDAELAKARRQIAASQFKTLTSASGRATDLASNWHEARDLDFTRSHLAAINAVTADDIRRVAAKLTENRLTYTSVDPKDHVPTATLSKAAAISHAITTHTLPNGLRLALLPGVEPREA